MVELAEPSCHSAALVPLKIVSGFTETSQVIRACRESSRVSTNAMSIAGLHAVRLLDSAETIQICLILAHIANKLHPTTTSGLAISVTHPSMSRESFFFFLQTIEL
jgi:hypothetical protein